MRYIETDKRAANPGPAAAKLRSQHSAVGTATPGHQARSAAIGFSHDFGAVSVHTRSGLASLAGVPLDANMRNRFEPHLGQDIGDVRVHLGPEATEAASALHVRAFTIGRDIVFNSGRYQPQSPEGRALLAHELAHVVQQRRSFPPDSRVAVRQRGDVAELEADRAASAMLSGHRAALSHGSQQLAIQCAPDAITTTPVKPETSIRDWLEQHQFAPPEKQLDDGERHVLLNGEEMTLSAAVKLASVALPHPPEVIRSIVTAALAEPLAKSAAGLPLIGANNGAPGINLASPRDAFGLNPAIAKTVELSSIDEFLNAHGFATPEIRDPKADRVLFDGKLTPIDDVVNRALGALGQYPSLKRADVVAHLRQRYVAARGGPSNQFVIGYTLVPKFAQIVGGAVDPNNPLRTQHQFSFTITRAHHPGDSHGFESSFQGSVTLADSGILNVQAGGQEAIVKPLLQGWIQVSGLIQVMVSENWSKSATGTTVISPALQIAGGAQVLLTPTLRASDYTFLNGHVQLGLQVLGGTQTSSSGTVGVANAGLVLNIPF